MLTTVTINDGGRNTITATFRPLSDECTSNNVMITSVHFRTEELNKLINAKHYRIVKQTKTEDIIITIIDGMSTLSEVMSIISSYRSRLS